MFLYLFSFSPFLFFLASQDSLELSGRLYLGAESLYFSSPPSLTQGQQRRWPEQLPPQWLAPPVSFPVISECLPPPIPVLNPSSQRHSIRRWNHWEDADWKRMEFHGRIVLIKWTRESWLFPALCQVSGSMCQPQARMGVFDRHPLSKCDLRLGPLALRVNSCYLRTIHIRGSCLSLLNEPRCLAHASLAFSTTWTSLKSSSGLFIYLFASTTCEVNQCVLIRGVVQLGYSALRNSPYKVPVSIRWLQRLVTLIPRVRET